MKRIIASLFLGILFQCYSIPVPGSMIWESLDSNDIIRHRLQFVSDRALYAAGGVVFTYPFSFSNPPIINVSLQSPGAADPSITYSAIVSNNSLGSCTIFVTKAFNSEGVTITEGATDEVLVSIFSVVDPF